MLLSHDDAARFFRLMWGLQFYVSQQRQLFPDVGSCEAFARLDGQQKVIARDALWEHPDLIDAYVHANPDKRTEEELAQILKWKGFLKGKFHLEPSVGLEQRTTNSLHTPPARLTLVR